ncbi:MAG: hypothetical protein M3O82_06635 [Verrucomicrobiota bacterium]|nr:hypothetical protein [Verrucomicrobiota bacterium]
MDTPNIDPPASRSFFTGPHTELNPELAKMLIFGLSLLLAVIVHAALTCYSIVPLSNGSAYKINRMTGKSLVRPSRSARRGPRTIAAERRACARAQRDLAGRRVAGDQVTRPTGRA